MAYQNFTTYTEVDPGSTLTVAANSVTATNMNRNTATYVYKDFGADYFGDFTHESALIATAMAAGSSLAGWELANIINDTQAIYASDGLIVRLFNSAGTILFQMSEVQGGVNSTDSYIASLSAQYYMRIKRTGTNLTCQIFSDAARTVLLDTLILTCATTKFRYQYAISSFGDATSAVCTGVSSNLEFISAINKWIFFAFQGDE